MEAVLEAAIAGGNFKRFAGNFAPNRGGDRGCIRATPDKEADVGSEGCGGLDLDMALAADLLPGEDVRSKGFLMTPMADITNILSRHVVWSENR